jgi:GR25 family glycosyltransferase involved in LPS biosynthesis
MKNKNKLEGFSPVYVINLKRREDRKSYINNLFLNNEIKYYTFIEAFDVKNNIEDIFLKINDKEEIASPSLMATSASHLKAIEYWINTSQTEYAIICEDDISFDPVEYWNFTWEEFINNINFDWDMIQLSICYSHKNTNFKLQKKKDSDFFYGAQCYVIKRGYAQTILKKYLINGKYNFNFPALEIISDAKLLYGHSDKVFVTSIFAENTELNNDNVYPNPHNVKTEKEKIMNFWKNNTLSFEDFINIDNNN